MIVQVRKSTGSCKTCNCLRVRHKPRRPAMHRTQRTCPKKEPPAFRRGAQDSSGTSPLDGCRRNGSGLAIIWRPGPMDRTRAGQTARRIGDGTFARRSWHLPRAWLMAPRRAGGACSLPPDRSRRCPEGLTRERGEEGAPSESEAAPATVCGERDAQGFRPTGRKQVTGPSAVAAGTGKAVHQALTRKPGNLPAYGSLLPGPRGWPGTVPLPPERRRSGWGRTVRRSRATCARPRTSAGRACARHAPACRPGAGSLP